MDRTTVCRVAAASANAIPATHWGQRPPKASPVNSAPHFGHFRVPGMITSICRQPVALLYNRTKENRQNYDNESSPAFELMSEHRKQVVHFVLDFFRAGDGVCDFGAHQLAVSLPQPMHRRRHCT